MTCVPKGGAARGERPQRAAWPCCKTEKPGALGRPSRDVVRNEPLVGHVAERGEVPPFSGEGVVVRSGWIWWFSGRAQ